MKVHMYAWVGGIPNLPAWFKHQEEAEVSLEQILELYATGNNVMLKHFSFEDGEGNLLAVDERGFGQR